MWSWNVNRVVTGADMAFTCTRAIFLLLLVFVLALLSPSSGGDEKSGRGRTDHYGYPLPVGAIARFGRLGFRHAGEVQSLAFSPDGKLLASTGADATLRIWDVAAGRENHRITLDEKLQRAGQQVAFSPNGRLLAFTSQEQTIFFWSTADWKEQQRLRGPNQRGASPAFAFAPDSKTFVWWGNDHIIRLQDLAAGKILRQWPGRKGHEPRFAFSPDSKRLAVALDLTTTLLDVADGKEICTIQEKAYAPYSLEFAPDGKTLAVGSIDCVRLCDAATGKEKLQLSGHAVPVHWMRFTRDGRALLASGADGVCRVWDPETGKEVRRLELEQQVDIANPVRLMTVAPDGRTLARVAWSDMHRIRLTDVKTGRELARSNDDPDPNHFSFTSDGKALASPCSDGIARVWDIATGKELLRFVGAEAKPKYFAFSADGKTLVSLGKRLAVWEAATGKLRREHMAPSLRTPYPTTCAISPDGKLLAIGEAFGGNLAPKYSIIWWNLDKDEEQSRSAEIAGRLIDSLAFTPDSKTTASADIDGTICLWDPVMGKALGQAADPVQVHGHQLAFAADGKTLLAARSHFVGGKSEITITAHDPATGKQLDQIPKVDVRGRAGVFSADRRFIACLDDFAAVNVFELATGKEIAKPREPPGQVRRLLFSPDGKRLALGNSDGTILVWDLATVRKQ
jgi:WD40 repeat protein